MSVASHALVSSEGQIIPVSGGDDLRSLFENVVDGVAVFSPEGSYYGFLDPKGDTSEPCSFAQQRRGRHDANEICPSNPTFNAKRWETGGGEIVGTPDNWLESAGIAHTDTKSLE